MGEVDVLQLATAVAVVLLAIAWYRSYAAARLDRLHAKVEGAMAALDGLAIGRRFFIHINNSNPALLPASPQRAALDAAGWDVARAGERIGA